MQRRASWSRSPIPPSRRLYIELINGAFLRAGGSPDEYRAGLERAISKGGYGGMSPELT
jgi:hypothetical protein